MNKYNYMNIKNYKNIYGIITRKSIKNDPDLTSNERETSIIINDDEDMALISSSQKAIMKYLLLVSKYFKTDNKNGLAVKNNKIVGVNGEISKNCIRFTKNPRKYFGRL